MDPGHGMLAPRTFLPARMMRLASMPWLAFLLVARVLHADILWQVGRPDESSGEFSHWRDPVTGKARLAYADPSQDPVFRVGRDDPSRAWFAYQPGPANGAAGAREHPFAIEFDLPEVPAHGAVLSLHLLAYSVRLPRLQVDVNGARGWYHQRPRLVLSAGDPASFYLPHYSHSLVRVPIRASLLKAGVNRVVLTPLDASPARDDAQPSGFPWPGVSGVVHDALVLEGADGPGFIDRVREPLARVEATPFYRRVHGRLHAVLELTVAPGDWADAREVELAVGGIRWAAPMPSGRDHGEARWAVEVPAFDKPTAARVTVRGARGEQSLDGVVEPSRRWTLLLVPNQHLDIGYTDHPSKVSELQSMAVDEVLALMRRHPEFRYTLDGSWVMQEYLRGRASGPRRELARAVKQGRVEVPAVYASHFTGFASLENLVRSLYPSRRLSREHGFPHGIALSTDVPSHSWSWASVLAASGVRHFVAASDSYRAPFLLRNGLHQRSPFAWEGPDGGRVWTWYSRHYHQGASLLGAPPSIESAMESLPRFLQAYDQPGRAGSTVILYGTQVENVAVEPGHASFARRWNDRFAFPRIEYSTFAEAMDRVTREAGPKAGSVRGDGGPYWEDGLAAHARITALARNTMGRARAAEIFSTVASLAVPGFRADPGAMDALWQSLLLTDEHTWHADVSTSDPDSQQSLRQGELRDHRTTDAARAAEHLVSRALSALAARIPNPSRTLVVFNALGWERDGWVEGDIPKGFQPVDLATGEPPPMEVLRTGHGFQRVRFLARGVPSVGYRCYTLRPATSPATAPGGEAGTVLVTRRSRVELDPGSGGIRGWRDRVTGREWVRAGGPWVLNQHLYVTGADTLPNRLVQFSTVAPEPALSVHGASGGRLVELRRHPWGVVARLESTNIQHPRITTTITLREDSPAIELENVVEKVAVRTKEAAYFAFPLAIPGARFQLASQNGFINPAKDLLPGACHEWFCHHEWVGVDSGPGSAGMLWSSPDAPLVTLGDIARGRWPEEFGQRDATVFSYVMANYTPEGYRAEQGGTFRFRYRLEPFESFDPVAAHRRGAEALLPLELHEIARNDKNGVPSGAWPPDRRSFLSIEPPGLSLVTWKMAEDGVGTVMRTVETAGNGAFPRVHGPLCGDAILAPCTAVEDPLPRATAPWVGPFGIGTFRVKAGNGTPVGR